MNKFCEVLAGAFFSGVLAAPTMMAQAACIPGNATVPPDANTTDPSSPFYIDTAGLNMKTSPPTGDPANPAYPPAKELLDETLPATDSEGNFIIGPTHPAAPEIAVPTPPSPCARLTGQLPDPEPWGQR
jgi:hypothetical protein